MKKISVVRCLIGGEAGFEPWGTQRVHLISSQAIPATLAPLRTSLHTFNRLSPVVHLISSATAWLTLRATSRVVLRRLRHFVESSPFATGTSPYFITALTGLRLSFTLISFATAYAPPATLRVVLRLRRLSIKPIRPLWHLSNFIVSLLTGLRLSFTLISFACVAHPPGDASRRAARLRRLSESKPIRPLWHLSRTS